jgi:hypothetical protein
MFCYQFPVIEARAARRLFSSLFNDGYGHDARFFQTNPKEILKVFRAPSVTALERQIL